MNMRLARATTAAALVTCLGISGMASGLRPAQAATRTLHIAWFNFPPAQILQSMIPLYTKMHPGLNIVVDTPDFAHWYTNNFDQFHAHKTNFAAAVLDSQWLGQAVSEHDILELTPWLKANLSISDFYPYLFAAYSQYPQRQPGETGALNMNHGHFYGIPWLSDAHGLAYRKDLFNDPNNQKAFLAKYHYKLGVPQSMDQIVDIADFFTRPKQGLYGIALHELNGYDASSEAFNGWCWNFGGDLWNAATGQIEGYINGPRCVHALQLVDHLAQQDSPPGSQNYFIAEVAQALIQGKVAMSDNWWSGMTGLLATKGNVLGTTLPQIESKLGFFNYPGETYMGIHSQWTPLGGMGLSISAYAPKADQDVMLDFAKWFEQPSIQTIWYQRGGGPTSKSVLNSSAFINAEPWNAQQSVSYTMVKDFWNVPEFLPMLTVQTADISASMAGKMSPQAALNDIAAKQAAVLKKTGEYPYYTNH